MRRKYDLRNKRNFVIILILSIAIISIFSLFIYKYITTSKIEYKVGIGSVVQDTNKNNINIEEDATLKLRWNGNYYLLYQDNRINLSKQVIVYDTITNSMKLYGKFYEIGKDGSINETSGENVLANTTVSKFYKIDDREYLLVSRQITSDDKSIETSDYLLVELDKMGNAKLSNAKLNLKTINPTKLITPDYVFDIANESLKYGLRDINLKKIIGSTNEYVDDDTVVPGESGTGDGDTDDTGLSGNGQTGMASGEGGVGPVINNTDTGQINGMGELKDKTKMTSIIRVQESLTQIDVDYVIYDPYDEYKTVYAEINKRGEIDVVYLPKGETHIVFGNLTANTEYKIKFIYTTVDEETNSIVPYTFDEMTLRTRMPAYSISIYKISTISHTLTYKIGLQSGYNINKVNTKLSFNYDIVDAETGERTHKSAVINGSVPVNAGDKSVIGTFNISDYPINEDTILQLSVVSVENSGGTLAINSDYTFRFGRK